MVRLEGERVVLGPLRQDEPDTVPEARDRLQIGAHPRRHPRPEQLRRRFVQSGQMARGHLNAISTRPSRRAATGDPGPQPPGQTLPLGVYELGIVIPLGWKLLRGPIADGMEPAEIRPSTDRLPR